ncbi:MAG: FAD-dependent oxidoreductase [Spirochaetia bacterium]|jgi:prolycopene isomerase
MQRGDYDVIVVGAGVGGLTAASLLAKSGLAVLVVDRNYMPGGALGSFRRDGITHDLGAAMLFGFGEHGFSPHRFLMNELEEPVTVIRHRALYRLNYGEDPIVFWPEMDRYLGELARVFPAERAELAAFYQAIAELFENVIRADPVYVSPSEMRPQDLRGQFFSRPLQQLATLRLLSTSAERLIRRHVRSERAIRFFDKLTSTYCYTTMAETPAILAATMFVDNHAGGSYYPVGSPAILAGRLERSIERHGGTFRYETEVTGILFDDGGRVRGVYTAGGEEITAPQVVYAGAIHPLFRKLLPAARVRARERARIESLVLTHPSIVLYGQVKADAVPNGTFPVEMFVDNKTTLDESEVTLYLSSLEEPNLAPEGTYVFTLIGPSFSNWPAPGDTAYQGPAYLERKEAEARRMLAILERRMPGFSRGIVRWEIGTPSTIERYLGKPGGTVAGPKQAIGQELLRRPHARTRWPGLYLAGESTVMGTGTPAVTVSGISAADVALRDRGMPEYRWRPGQRDFVTVVEGPVPRLPAPKTAPGTASFCGWCEIATCRAACPSRIDIRGVLRRIEMENFEGARRRLAETGGRPLPCPGCAGHPCEQACQRTRWAGNPVPIVENLVWADRQTPP